jgi:ppGpp synthetase/RelA/SpoT-type nucleotidyltranferase
MEKVSWTDRVRNEEVLSRLKQERSILSKIKRRKDNWIGYILPRKCLLKALLNE